MKKHFLLASVLFSASLMAQDGRQLSGQIKDEQGFELLGATVQVKGTSNGTVTDFDGNFILDGISEGDILIISYVGFESKEIVVGKNNTFNIVLEEDASDLEEVVVIGYGTSKSKDLTSPITTISADEITSMSSTSAMSAVQGKVPGVTIVNTGVPGESPSVSIRGVGSIQNSSPLYVVDGMFLDDINFLSPNDIETMSILKDASAAAIYGVRAANGVVLITTKGGGKNKKPTVTYDGYYGLQTVTQRLEMANSAQYADFMRQSGNQGYINYVNKSLELYGAVAGTVDGPNTGTPAISTDWYDALIQNVAPIHNHNLSVIGGTEKSSYAFSTGYMNQEGMMNATGGYDRINLRGKVDYDVTDMFKVGFSTILTHEHRQIDDNAAWFNAYTASPLYPIYDNSLSDEASYPKKFAAPTDLGYDTYYSNPMATAYYKGDRHSNITRILPNVYFELRPFSKLDLAFRSSMNMDIAFGLSKTYTPEYKVGNAQNTTNSLSKTTALDFDYIWDNTLTWKESWVDHNLTSMAGFSIRQENNRWLTGTAQDVTNKDYLSSGNAETRTSNDGGARFRGMSAFARFSYDYQYKYLLSLTMRADGSSKYQEKWGYFPSVGLGWVISEENFAVGLKDSNVDFLKLRASWGMLGNDRVPANDGFSSISVGGLGNSGVYDGNLIPGMINNTVFSNLNWEVVHETNVGIDADFFDHRLNAEVDYYSRDTKDMVILTTLPMGNGHVLRNSGCVRNSGFEVMVNWTDRIGEDFTYSIGGNITTIKNEVRDLSGEPYLQTGSAEFPQRSIVGHELYSFYGWKMDGIYQNQAEIDACPIAKANGLKPGDIRFVDKTGDDVLDDKDRQLLGSPNPNLTYGINLGVGYKGWNLSAAFAGVSGNTIFNRRRADITKHGANNMDANLVESVWRGEGTTNDTPSAAGMFNTFNTGRMSDFYLESGSYFRVQNIRLSYDFPKAMIKKAKLKDVQLYLNADRPFTYYTSNGFTPEVAGGIDQQVYPIASTFSFGAKVSF